MCGGSKHRKFDDLESVLGHPRGLYTQKKPIYLYFLIEFHLRKAMEKICMIVVHDIPNYKQYFQK